MKMKRIFLSKHFIEKNRSKRNNMKWLLKPVYTVDGIVNVFLRSTITLLLLTVIILIHLLYFTIQENWFYVLLLIIMTLVSTYICSTGTLALLLTLLTAYIVMIVRNDGFPDFFQDDDYLEGFKRKRGFKKPKVKMPKVKNVVKSTIKIVEKNNLKRKAVNVLKKYGKYTPQGYALLFLMRQDAERRKKLREERRRRAEERRKREEEERRKRDQAARDTALRQQTKDALDKTNYEINRQQIEFQIKERERIRRERINNELGVNIPEHAIDRSNETKEFINGIQAFW